jgi:hypothetical protein
VRVALAPTVALGPRQRRFGSSNLAINTSPSSITANLLVVAYSFSSALLLLLLLPELFQPTTILSPRVTGSSSSSLLLRFGLTSREVDLPFVPGFSGSRQRGGS